VIVQPLKDIPSPWSITYNVLERYPIVARVNYIEMSLCYRSKQRSPIEAFQSGGCVGEKLRLEGTLGF